MQDNSIGLYNYRLDFKKPRLKPILLDELPGPKILEFANEFAGKFPEPPEDAPTTRRWYIDDVRELSDGFSAIVQYGRTGYGSKLVDGKTRKENYNRKATDIEVIPLYLRLWLPTTQNYGIFTFQAFGGYSCNSLVLFEWLSKFRKAYTGYICQAIPILPHESTLYQDAPVTALVLKRRKSPSDIADAQIGNNAEFVNINTTITNPKRTGTLGRFRDLAQRFKSSGRNGMRLGNVEYESVSARIRLEGGGSTMIPLAGSATRTCLLNISDDVKKLAGHPIRSSISSRVELVLDEISKGM